MRAAWRRGRPALVALGLGAGIAIAAQLAAPVAVPLYDGVPILDPYRYLDPTGTQPGDPSSFESAPGLENGASRAFVAATTEQPPQAQLIALAKAFRPPSGSTEMNVTVEPVQPDTQPTQGSIAGNVYAFAVLDENGVAYTLSGDPKPTVILRAPEGVTDAVIGHLTDAGWVALPTDHGGGLGLFSTEVSELGNYAILQGVSPPSDLARLAIILVTIALPLAVAIAYFVRRARRARLAAEAAAAARSRARVPSKRRKRR